MLTELVVATGLDLLTGAISLLPDADPFVFDLGGIAGTVGMFNVAFPIAELGTLAALLLAYNAALMAFAVARQAAKFIPVFGGG